MDGRPKYCDLYFGKSDSRNEANDDPDGFVRSYVDLNGSASSVIAGERFLVLGPKGAGKSALGWYLEACAGKKPFLAKVTDASELPLAEVPRLQTGQPSGPERTVVAWKFILLCNYLELLLRDQVCEFDDSAEVHRVAKLLRDFGFMGDASGRALTRASAVTVEIPIPKLGTIYRKESRSTLNIYNLIPYLESWAAQARSESRHILMLDGLDSIFLNDPKYDESLSSLVQASYALNQKLRQHSATGSVVLLLRNDVFNRISLSLPDSQKMRDDLSLDLDWRIMSGPQGINSPLMRLIDKKAALAASLDELRVLDYFPANVTVGRRSDRARQFPVLQYLLNLTRHTPRDLLRLFEEIRRVNAEGSYAPTRSGILSQDEIREGVLRYSSRYFVGAISNEFAGFDGGPECAAAALTALKGLNKQEFTSAEFEQALVGLDVPPDFDHRKLLRLLFFAGAIGNQVGYGSDRYMQFYHRREESEIYLHGSFILHNALIHAWGLGRSQPKAPARVTQAQRRPRVRARNGRSPA